MMEMLETKYTETLSELVNEHLHENNSIPCFLSAVTLNLHNAMDNSEPPSEPEQVEEEEEEDEGPQSSEEDSDQNDGNYDEDEPIEISD